MKMFEYKGTVYSNLRSRSAIINGASSGNNLHDKYSKAVDIASLIQHLCVGIPWCNVGENPRLRESSLFFPVPQFDMVKPYIVKGKTYTNVTLSCAKANGFIRFKDQ